MCNRMAMTDLFHLLLFSAALSVSPSQPPTFVVIKYSSNSLTARLVADGLLFLGSTLPSYFQPFKLSLLNSALLSPFLAFFVEVIPLLLCLSTPPELCCPYSPSSF